MSIQSVHSQIRERNPHLLPFTNYVIKSGEIQCRYRESLTKHLTEAPHEVEGTAESNWEVLKSCIWKAGAEIIGRERKKICPTGF